MRRQAEDEDEQEHKQHDELEELMNAPVEILPKEINLTGDPDEKIPNTLVITVLQARNLPTSAIRSSLSCYVKLSSLGKEFKTSIKHKVIEPFWNEAFSFRALDWNTTVTLSVRDKINVKMRFVGQIRVSCSEVSSVPGMAFQSWLRLCDRNWQTLPSELEIKVALVYSPRNDTTLASHQAFMQKQVGGHEVSLSTAPEGGLAGVIADQDDETEEEILARKRELERQEMEHKSTIYANLKQGDYQVQVHIIEARDLKGENLRGTSNPVCHVEILGKKKKTSTKYNTLGCVFDEILFFHFKNIGKNELKKASIKFSVFNDEIVLRNELIGSYSLDCLSVYFRPDHELYRKWVALHDHLNDDDRGIQGFLLVSVNVTGPGDTFRVHDREAEILQEAEEAHEDEAMRKQLPPVPGAPMQLNSDLQQMILVPPTVDLKLEFLVVKVYKAEDLPAMDEETLLTAAGIDAYVQVGFGVHPKCISSVVTVKGHNGLSPVFLEELWIPVFTPTLDRSICLSIWDRDLTKSDDLVGNSFHDYHQVCVRKDPKAKVATSKVTATLDQLDQLDTASGATEAQAKAEQDEQYALAKRWINFYGPPLDRVNSKRAKVVLNTPEFGSVYRGRLLVALERVDCPSKREAETFHVKDLDDPHWEAEMPPNVKYVLRCAVFFGVDLPQFTSLLHSPTKLRVKCSMGKYEVNFEGEQVSKDGKAIWRSIKEKWPIVLPADLTQLPDLIITLERELERGLFVSVAFYRLKASDLYVKGFQNKMQWIFLKEEITRRQTKNALERNQFGGSLLMRVGFGREEQAVRTPWDADKEFEPLDTTVFRELRVNLFQCRQLFAKDRTKLPNAFVSVTCAGVTKKSSIKYRTADPLFYETLVVCGEVPVDRNFAPDLVFRVYDSRVSSSLGLLGEVRFPMSSAVKAMPNTAAIKPQWLYLHLRPENDAFIDENYGQILVSVQFIDHQSPKDTLIDPPPIYPDSTDATLDIVALGIRQMKTMHVLGLQNPFMEFELSGACFADGSQIKQTNPSNTPEPRNANFLENLRFDAKFPIDTVFAPILTLRVCEKLIGGLHRRIHATCDIDLSKKLPWSTEYLPPQQQVFEPPHPPSQLAQKSKKEAQGHGGDDGHPTGGGPPSPSKPQRKRSTFFHRSRPLLSRAGDDEEDTNPLSHDDDDDDDDGDMFIHNGPGQVEGDDDGVGLGEIPMQKVELYPHAIQLMNDPAVQKERENETKRRYLAGKKDAFGSQSVPLVKPKSPTHQAIHHGVFDKLTPKQAPYLEGRDWWINQDGEELEQYLQVKALETYPLFRSVLTRPSLLKRRKVRVQVKTGLFKGLISVHYKNPKKTAADKASSPSKTGYDLLDMRLLQEPQLLEVRVYVLKGSNLQAKNANGYSDPYLQLKLGKNKISDRSNYKKKTLNPEFYKCFCFKTSLPGPSQLDIGVWDYDLIGSDSLIGKTTIDLEDRWFHHAWQEIGQDNAPLVKKYGCLKPIEYRHLYTDSRQTSQGVLKLWVDVLSAQKAALTSLVLVEPPPPEKFEVRVVIWRAEDVRDLEMSEINDYYVKGWMEGVKPQTTDVHWRCSNSKPCWNWRFKFTVEFPLRAPEFGRLHLQIWDKDVVKWDDVIAEAQLDLYKWLQLCHQTRRSVSPFEDLKKMARAESGLDDQQLNTKKPRFGSDDDAEDDGSDADDDDHLGTADEDLSPSPNGEASHLLRKKQSTSNKKKNAKDQPAQKKKTAFKLPSPKLPSIFKIKSKGIKQSSDKGDGEAQAAVAGFLDFIGMGKLPEDAEWITMYLTDRESGNSVNMGKVGISIQILPEKEAQLNAVGLGRSEPNMNPYLPPPVGRMRLTANPFAMLKELIGPKMCLRITILLCCLGCVSFFAMFGGTVMSTLTFIHQLQANADRYNYQGPLPFDPHALRNQTL